MGQAKLAYEAAGTRHDQLLVAIIALIALMIGLSAFLAFVTIRTIVTGVSRLNHVSQCVASGDLTVRCDYTAHDELGHIGSDFNRMADIFQKVIRELSSTTLQLAAAAEQTSTITAHTSDRVHQQEKDTEAVKGAEQTADASTHQARLAANLQTKAAGFTA